MYSVMETISIGAFHPLFNNILSIKESQINSGGKVLEFLNSIVKKIPVSEEIIAASIFLLIMVVVSTLFGFFAESFATWYRYKLHADFLNKVYHRILGNHYRFFLEKKQGELLYIGMDASQSVGEMLLYFPRVGVEFFRLSVITIFLLTISLKITLAVFCIMLVYGFLVHFLSKRVIHSIAVNLQNAQSEITSVFSESIAGIRQIKVFDNFEFWRSRFNKHSYKARIFLTKNVIYGYIPMRLILIVGGTSIVLSIIYVKLYMPEHFVTFLPIIAVYILALQRLMPSISSIGYYWMGLKSLSPRLEATYNTLTDKEYLIEENGKRFSGLNGTIRFDNVSFSYPTRKNILKDITINIRKNQTTAIVGESGSGKSTMVDLLIRLYDPESGRIIVDGTDSRDFSLSSWLGNIGMVSQDTFIFHTSVRDNIKMGNPEATYEEIVNAAKIAYAHQFIMELPKKYDTILGDRGIKLSGGQRQRIAIARAVIRKPDILILDEATSSLDNISEKIVQEALQEAKKNRTTIIIAHRLSTIEYADRIAVMKNGKIIEEGNHEGLLKQQGYYYNLYQKQKENI